MLDKYNAHPCIKIEKKWAMLLKLTMHYMKVLTTSYTFIIHWLIIDWFNVKYDSMFSLF